MCIKHAQHLKLSDIGIPYMKHDIDHLLQQIPCGIFWKDCHSIYLGGNKIFLKAAGFNSSTDLVGKTDYDLPWYEYAAAHLASDAQALSGHLLINAIETRRQASGKVGNIIVNKSPLFDKNGILIGLIGSYMEFNEQDAMQQAILRHEISLAPQQLTCLSLVIQGMTAKQVANALGLSQRTVEFYIALIKRKFNCRTTTELLVKIYLAQNRGLSITSL